MYRVQLDFAGVVKLIRHKMAVDQPAWSIIETADGSGDAAYRILTQEYGIGNISHYCPRKSKEDRFYEIVPVIEGGNVYIPASAPWLQEYRNEFMAFPNNAPGHDDMLDAVSQFLRHANELVRKAGGIRPTKYLCDTPVYRMISFGPKRLVRYS
jgi:predicted phage terminase large subunit-like protein